MKLRTSLGEYAIAAMALLAVLSGADAVLGQQQGRTNAGLAAPAASSLEQGRTSLRDSFGERPQWRLEKRRDALRDTEFDFNLRTFYFDRQQFDGSESQAFTIGGWVGLKTGYFLDHLSLGVTGYTSQKLVGDQDKDGTHLLKPGQESYSVLGEAYADIRIVDDLNLYVGRKGYDSPFISRHDSRMTPNTVEAVVLQGKAKLGQGGAVVKYGAGYFDKIKERNSVEFVSMSSAAGASIDRGVFTAGALYEKGNFSIGAIEYYCPDTINIGYAEATLELPMGTNLITGNDWCPRLAAQFTDQRSVGGDLLLGDSFSVQQFGIKAELPVKRALFTVAYTQMTDGANMQDPWSGYPGYTSVQVEDFDRAGEGAFLLRASYEFTTVKGLSAYALAVLGTNPAEKGQYRRNEYDLNLEWVPPEGVLKGLSVRLRYALVHQDGGDVRDLQDFHVICNYAITF